jgi:serine/threonine protein kinase
MLLLLLLLLLLPLLALLPLPLPLLVHRYNAEKADIWSAGVMLYAMLAGRYPFDSDMPDHVRLQLMTQRPLRNLPPGLSAECRHLLEGMLHPNEDERMTVAQIKQDPWFLM